MFRQIVAYLPSFAAVAKPFGFSQAAAQLLVSQAAVSYQIQQKLGFKTLIRHKGSKVELSVKG